MDGVGTTQYDGKSPLHPKAADSVLKGSRTVASWRTRPRMIRNRKHAAGDSDEARRYGSEGKATAMGVKLLERYTD